MGNSFTDNSKHLFLQAEKMRNQTHHVWLTRNEEVIETLRSEGYNAYYFRSIKGQYYVLRARCCFITHNIFDIPWWLSGNIKVIRLGHGIPFKKYGWANTHEVSDMSIINKMIRQFIIDKVHYTIASSDYYATKVAEATDISKEHVWITGLPRMDYLLSKEYNGKIYAGKEINSTLNIINQYDKSIFYFPTWRRDAELNPYLSKAEFSRVNAQLSKNNMIMIFRKHPAADSISIDDFSNIIKIPNNGDFYPLIKETDILLTDYSSIFYDYLYKNDQVIFYPHDLENYLSTRDLFFKYEDLPGDIVQNIDELTSSISDSRCNISETERNSSVSDWRKQTFNNIDKNNSKRVISHVEHEVLGE